MKLYRDCDRNIVITEKELENAFIESGTEARNFTEFVNNCLLANGGCLVEIAPENHYADVIYNLVLLLNDKFDTMDIDNENFIDYICNQSGLCKELYYNIVED